MKKENEEGISVKKLDNFSEWYTQIIKKADLIDYSKVSGCLVFKPSSFVLWESAKEYFNKKIKKDGVENVYFPLLIPEKLLKKESKHIEGFSPEVAWVTHVGNRKLSERLAIRPTSETLMYDSYSKWIRSWKDLPLRYNQWCSVVRWEFKNPVPFLRTREFLWQEGHTVFSTKKEAEKEASKILNFYEDLFKDIFAVPVLKGKKSEKEKFAGADYSLSIETLLPNGKAIQGATSHHLGQNFSKPFDIKFIDKNEKKQYAWQNSWGFSTRSLGIMIAIHGDDKGLILPPKIAPIKAIIVPILFEKTMKKVLNKSKEIQRKIGSTISKIDSRTDYTPGWKFNNWEMRGVPIRIEIGPRDVEKKQVVMVRRDTGEKIIVKEKEIKNKFKELLKEIQENLFNNAKKFLDSNIIKTDNLEGLKKAIKNKKIAFVPWCGCSHCEEKLKDKTSGAKSLNIPFNQKKLNKKCIGCKSKAEYYTYFAKSY
jgi:prolyl-tRNA synthetase